MLHGAWSMLASHDHARIMDMELRSLSCGGFFLGTFPYPSHTRTQTHQKGF